MTTLKSKFVKASLGLIAAAGLLLGAGVAGAATYNFATNLSLGSKGADVMALQQALNSDPDTALAVLAGNAGSPGHESMTFGPATKAAVIKFQLKHNIAPAIGNVFTLTRGVLNSMSGTSMGGGTSTVPGCTSTSGFSPLTGQPCNGSMSTGTQTGPVTVSLATDNPAAAYLVTDQSGADLLHLNFMGNGTVTNVTLHKLGVAADATYNGVYLYDGTMRITDAAYVSGNGMISFNNGAGLFTVNGSKMITVRVDLNSVSGNEVVGLGLDSFVAGGTTVTASVNGNQFALITGNGLAAVTLGGSNLVAGNANQNPQPALVVWQNQMTVSNHDVNLNSLAFRMVGSIDHMSIGNFMLKVDGVTVATVASVDANGYVTFVPTSPFLIKQGGRTVQLFADVTGGASRTFSFRIDRQADARFTDAATGYGRSLGTFNSTSANAGTFTMSATSSSNSNVTFQKITTGDNATPSGDVIAGALDVPLARFDIKSYGEQVRIETLALQITTSEATAYKFKNGRILFGGQQYGSQTNINTTAGAQGATTFNTNYILNAGQDVVMEVRADMIALYSGGTTITNTTLAGDSVSVTVTGATGNTIGLYSGNTSTVPAGATPGNAVNATTATLTVAKYASYANQTVVSPQTAFKIGSWSINNTGVEDAMLYTLGLTVTPGTTTTDKLTAVTLKDHDTGAVLGSPYSTICSTSCTGAATLSFSTNLTVAKNSGTKIVDLYADVASGITTGTFQGSFESYSGNTVPSGTTVTGTSLGKTGQLITVGSGVLTSTVDGSTPTARLLGASSTGVKVGSFKFQASNDVYSVNRMVINFAGTNANTVITGVTLKNGSTVLGSGTLSGTSATINASPLFTVTSGGTVIVDVYVDLGSVGAGAGNNGANVAATLASYRYVDSVNGTRTAGVSTGSASYLDNDASSTVTVGDTRLVAVDSYATTATTGAAFTTGSGNGAVDMAYGITNGRTVIVSSDGSSNLLATAGTLVATDGATCLAQNLAGATVTVGSAVNTVRFITCSTSTGNIRIATTNAGNTAGEALSGATKNITYTIARTTGGYTAASTVAAYTAGTTGTTTASDYTTSLLGAPALTTGGYYVYKAIPTVTMNNTSATLNGSGTQTLADLNMASTGTGIAWKKIKFAVIKSTDVTLSSFNFVNSSGVSVPNTAISFVATATDTDADCADAADETCTIVITHTAGNEDTVNGSTSYKLNASAVVGTAGGNQYVTTSINPSGLTFAAPTTDATAEGLTGTFIWSDLAGTVATNTVHSDTTNDWNNDYLVQNIQNLTVNRTISASF